MKEKYIAKEEYWINVFSSGQVGSPLSERLAKVESFNMKKLFHIRTLYRIHVRLK